MMAMGRGHGYGLCGIMGTAGRAASFINLPTLSPRSSVFDAAGLSKLSAAAQKHGGKKPAEAQRVWANTRSVARWRALASAVFGAARAEQDGQKRSLYYDHLAKLPSTSPERRECTGELVDLMNRPG